MAALNPGHKKLLFLFVVIALGLIVAWLLIEYQPTQKELVPSPISTSTPQSPTVSTPVVSTSTVQKFQTYRNEEFGFEFQYPEDWSFHVNTFGGPFSKFNLVGASPEENGLPNPLAPSILINIVTPDFADRAVMSRRNAGAIESDFIVDGIPAKKYEYTSNFPKVSIDFPFREFRMILAASIEYEDVFNRVLSSFKFISPIETKTYRSEEWGFEFQYPGDWSFEVNGFYSPFSKFNLQGNSAAKNYNPLIPSFLINIVTPDFADHQFSDLRNVVSEINIGGVAGLKYEYEMQYGSYKVFNITIILPLNQYRIILRMHKEHESIFNQIIASFKFLPAKTTSTTPEGDNFQ